MRKTYHLFYYGIAAAMLMAGISACKKQGSSWPASDCINQSVEPLYELDVNAAQLDSIKVLFAANNLDVSLYHFIDYYANIYTDPGRPAQTQVTAVSYFNGLPVFGSNSVFVFTNGKLDTAYLYAARPSSDNASGHQSPGFLRSTFLDHASMSKMYSSIGTSTGDPSQVQDSCLNITLGYVDASTIPGSTVPYDTKLVKVWAVSPSVTAFPEVYVDDATGNAWGKIYLFP